MLSVEFWLASFCILPSSFVQLRSVYIEWRLLVIRCVANFQWKQNRPFQVPRIRATSNTKNRSDAVRAERSRTHYTLRSTLSYVDILQGLDIYSSLLLALALMMIYFVNPAEYMFVCSVASD